MSKKRAAPGRGRSAAAAPNVAAPRPADHDWKETLPVALGLIGLFLIPWVPTGEAGLRWSWKLVHTHYAEAIPAIGGLIAGLFVLLATRYATPRMRDLLWALFGFVLLAAGLSERDRPTATQ